MRGEDPTTVTDDMTETLEREAQQWLVLLTSGSATAADANALKLWCGRSLRHAQAFAEANLLWDHLGSAAPRALRSQANRQVAIGRRALLGGAGAMAATAVGYLAIRPPLHLWPSPYELAADFRTNTGERRRIDIENGVSIDLNTRTSFNIRQDVDVKRLELVTGEAVITTSRALVRPLTVAAAGGRVRAVDAEFDLRCNETGAVVTCHRGSVDVEVSGSVATLREGQQITYAGGALEPATTVDPAIVMAWRDGLLVFRDIPLSQVVEEINRYRPGRIILMNRALGRRLVAARIPVDQVDDLIALVREAYGAKVSALPGGIVLLS